MLLKSLKVQVPIEDNVHVKDKETASSEAMRALEAHPPVLQRRLNINVYIYIFLMLVLLRMKCMGKAQGQDKNDCILLVSSS